jgi:3-oxoacyl-[acyl-carrier protein] reductase
MTDAHSLKGRVALITGASGDIGRAAGLLLAQAGATVGVHYNTNRTAAEQTARAIEAAGGVAHVLHGDLSVEADANAVVDQLIARAGRLDILFNNAGSPLKYTTIEACSLELWNNIFATNATSAFLVTRRAIPHLRASKHGSIINNLTLSIQTGGAGGGGVYAAAKGALQVMTRTLAKELAPHVRVNAIMPGVIATAHHETFSTPAKMEDYRKQTPLARNGAADEVAQAVLFLASDGSSFMTGAVLDINGGRFLR